MEEQSEAQDSTEIGAEKRPGDAPEKWSRQAFEQGVQTVPAKHKLPEPAQTEPFLGIDGRQVEEVSIKPTPTDSSQRIKDSTAPKPKVSKKRISPVLGIFAGVAIGLLSASYIYFGSHPSTPQHAAPTLTQLLMPLNASLESSPNDANLYNQRAAIYFDNDQPANALNDLNKALKLNPKLWQAYELRADVESYLNMTTQALADANKAVKATPNDALAWVKLATVENRMYQYNKALAHAKHALELNDKEGLACGEMSASLAGMNRYKESLQWINKHAALEAPNVHERVLSGRAMEEFHAGDYSDSVKDATAAVDRNSIDRGLDMLVRALGEQGLGMLSQAEQDVEQGLALEKNPARGHRIAGDYYRLIGDDAQAIEEYNKSISLFPQGTNSYRNRGITYYRQGSLHNGLEDLTAACRSRPSCITLSYKALMEQDLGMQEDADRDIAQAAVVSEPLSLFYSNRGAIEFKRKDLVKALADATKAKTMDNRNADAYQLLGNIYLVQGNSQQSELNFARAKQLGYPGSSPPAGW